MFVMSCSIFQETFNNFFEQAYNKKIQADTDKSGQRRLIWCSA
jgi:hypothetical protein